MLASTIKVRKDLLVLIRNDMENWLRSFPKSEEQPTKRYIEQIDSLLDDAQGGDTYPFLIGVSLQVELGGEVIDE